MQLRCAKNQATRAAQSAATSLGSLSLPSGGGVNSTLRHATLGPASSSFQRLHTHGSCTILHHDSDALRCTATDRMCQTGAVTPSAQALEPKHAGERPGNELISHVSN